MLFVDLYINQRCLGRLGAQRIKGDECPDSINTYRLDDYTEIKHRYGDGAEKLAIKILKHYSTKKRKAKLP